MKNCRKSHTENTAFPREWAPSGTQWAISFPEDIEHSQDLSAGSRSGAQWQQEVWGGQEAAFTNRLQTWHDGWVVVLWPALMFGSQVPFFFWKIQNNIKQNKNAMWSKIGKIHSMNRSLESNANRIILSILLFQYFIVVFSVQYCVSVFNCRGILLFFSF